jgi:hypothetical protein
MNLRLPVRKPARFRHSWALTRHNESVPWKWQDCAITSVSPSARISATDHEAAGVFGHLAENRLGVPIEGGERGAECTAHMEIFLLPVPPAGGVGWGTPRRSRVAWVGPPNNPANFQAVS